MSTRNRQHYYYMACTNLYLATFMICVALQAPWIAAAAMFNSLMYLWNDYRSTSSDERISSDSNSTADSVDKQGL